MSIGMRILAGLVALITAAGVASAQNDPCPECDPDGPANESGSYSSIDLGVIDEDDVEALVDTDLSLGDSTDEKGFWAWLSLCLSAFVAGIEDILGVDLDVDASVDAYLSDDGIDLDATVMVDDAVCENADGNLTSALGADDDCAFGFDRSELGDLDGQTWEAMQEVHATLGTENINLPVGGEHVPEDLDLDLCIFADLNLATCG